METYTLLKQKHLVMVRHGESEGDVRRASKKSRKEGQKHPRDEGQTELGHEQSHIAGLWISKFILQKYNLNQFDAYLTSPLIRTKQSTISLSVSNSWTEDLRLAERDRGDIQGLNRNQHKDQYPESYKTMQEHPFYWVPPSGESLLRVSMRFSELINEITKKYSSILMMTHRDVMWASHVPLGGGVDEIEEVDTDKIGNSHIFHFTNINPSDGTLSPDLNWKMSVDPLKTNGKEEWIDLRKAKSSQIIS